MRPMSRRSEAVNWPSNPAAGLLGQLQGHAIGGDHIVAADDAFLLDAEDVLEIDGPSGMKPGVESAGGHPNSSLNAGRKRSRR